MKINYSCVRIKQLQKILNKLMYKKRNVKTLNKKEWRLYNRISTCIIYQINRVSIFESDE